jgi:hypothetical protein
MDLNQARSALDHYHKGFGRHAGVGVQHAKPVTTRPGTACTGTEEVTKTFRFVASWFADVRSYGWDLLAVAFEARHTASRNGRTPASTKLPVTHMYRREDQSWGVDRDLKPRDQPGGGPDPPRRFHQCLVFDHQPLGSVVGVVLVKVVGVVLVKVGLVHLEAGNLQRLCQRDVALLPCGVCRCPESLYPVPQLGQVSRLPCPTRLG